jgi:hypothetical protein
MEIWPDIGDTGSMACILSKSVIVFALGMISAFGLTAPAPSTGAVVQFAAPDQPAAKLPEPCSVLVRGTFVSLGNCAKLRADGSFSISRAAIVRLRFGRDGLASIAIRGRGYAYVRRDGRALLVPTFDNGPDEFADGLVRVKIGERFGYANTRLLLVIPAEYDGALPFANGRARACIDCTLATDGEHIWYKGGQNLCLDVRGLRRPTEECDQTDHLR